MDNTTMPNRRYVRIQNCQTAGDNAKIRKNAARKVQERTGLSDRKDTHTEMRQEVKSDRRLRENGGIENV